MKTRYSLVASFALAALEVGCATQQAEVKPQAVVEAPKPPPEPLQRAARGRPRRLRRH